LQVGAEPGERQSNVLSLHHFHNIPYSACS